MTGKKKANRTSTYMETLLIERGLNTMTTLHDNEQIAIFPDIFDYWNNRQAELETDCTDDDETMTENYLETFEIE